VFPVKYERLKYYSDERRETWIGERTPAPATSIFEVMELLNTSFQLFPTDVSARPWNGDVMHVTSKFYI
jgi:hypothetical protein